MQKIVPALKQKIRIQNRLKQRDKKHGKNTKKKYWCFLLAAGCFFGVIAEVFHIFTFIFHEPLG